MALNIKNLEVEKLAGEVANLAHETKRRPSRGRWWNAGFGFKPRPVIPAAARA